MIGQNKASEQIGVTKPRQETRKQTLIKIFIRVKMLIKRVKQPRNKARISLSQKSNPIDLL